MMYIFNFLCTFTFTYFISISTYGRRAFAVAGPTMFNTLPDDLRDPAVSITTFGQSLKTHLILSFVCLSARLAHWGCLT